MVASNVVGFQLIFILAPSKSIGVPRLKEFELTIPQQYIDYINKEIKKPKRANTEILELWLERELDVENPGAYGNLPTDESHVEVQALPNGKYILAISKVCFDMILAHVQPEPHAPRIKNDDALHCWLDLKTNKIHLQEHIEVKEIV